MAEWIYNEVTHDWEERPSEAPAALDYVSAEKASVVLPMTQQEVDDAHAFGSFVKNYLDEAVRGMPRVQAPPSKEDMIRRLEREVRQAEVDYEDATADLEDAKYRMEVGMDHVNAAQAALREFLEEHGDS